MDNEKKIEIPFGAFDSELIRQEISIPNGFKATIEGDKIILTRIESEDETIRKILIHFFSRPEITSLEYWEGISKKEVLAWLEKQGESYTKRDVDDAWLKGMCDAKRELDKQGDSPIKWNKNTKDCKPKVSHSVLMKTTHGIAEGEWQGEYWHQYRWAGIVRDSDVLSWTELSDLDKQGEQKPFDYENANIQQKDFAPKVEPKFKVKYAGSEYNVLEIKDIAGVAFYGIEDEPNHIDYVKAENCEIIDGYAIKENGSPYPTKPAVFSEKKPKRMISAEAKEAMYDKPADKVEPKCEESKTKIFDAPTPFEDKLYAFVAACEFLTLPAKIEFIKEHSQELLDAAKEQTEKKHEEDMELIKGLLEELNKKTFKPPFTIKTFPESKPSDPFKPFDPWGQVCLYACPSTPYDPNIIISTTDTLNEEDKL